LTVPIGADGHHTLLVRGRVGAVVDDTPAARGFTLDNTPPKTTLVPTATAIEIVANEPAELMCRVDGRPFEVCASPYTLPVLAPGPHTFEAYAIDVAGNADARRAKHAWTVAAPKPVATPSTTPAPVPQEPQTAAVVEAPVSAAPATLAPRIALTLRYRFRHGRFTRFEATGPEAVRVTVNKRAVTLKRLVGKRLRNGTKITVRSGADSRTLTIRRGRVIA
jgi:hypothetical protein